jgi:shikimate dehydrogenase
VTVKRVAVLGHPVGHSRSPAMHNAAFRELGLEWHYEAIDVEPERFAEFVRGMPAGGFAGANVTIPHKVAALEVADTASAVARGVGAANTLVFRDGTIHAENTDVEGTLTALRERAPEAPAGMRALVLGAGGAARAVVFALIQGGAAAVDVWNRHPDRAMALVSDLAPAAVNTRLTATKDPSARVVDLLVNATSVGMDVQGPHPDAAPETGSFKELPVSADELDDRLIVVDLVYGQNRTPLACAARARGLRCADGIDVLVHQGAASFRLWTGMQAPLGAMRSGATGKH